MKKLFLIICLISFFCENTQAQSITPIGAKKSTLECLGGFQADSVFWLPKKYATTFTNLDSPGRMWYDATTNTVFYHNGTSRVEIGGGVPSGQHQYIYKLTALNTASIGNSTIGSTLSSYGRFIVTNVNFVIKAFSGTISIPPQVSVGFTPSAYTDIIGPVILPASPVVHNVRLNSAAGTALTIPPSTIITARISVAAAFSVPGDYVIDVYVQGYYETL